MKLGKIEEVDIRTVWAHEQYDFSKWLAEDENIKALGEVLNLSLTDVNTEQFVGSYRCDIICKDELTGKSVLIENQLMNLLMSTENRLTSINPRPITGTL